MRTTVLILAFVATLGGSFAEEKISLTTVTGKVYEEVTISKVDPDGLKIMHSGGIAKVKFSDLNTELQEKYGYDPSAAQGFEQAQKEKNIAAAEAREARAKKAAEIATQYSAETSEKTLMSMRPATGEKVKELWKKAKRADIPARQTDRLYSPRVKAYQEVAAIIDSGAFDDQAALEAGLYNIELYTTQGKIELAEQAKASVKFTRELIIAKEITAQQQAVAQSLTALAVLSSMGW